MHVQTVEFGPVLATRRLFSVRRRMVALDCDLRLLVGAERLVLPELPDDAAGYRIFSAPAGSAARMIAGTPSLIAGSVHDYERRYITMDGGYDGYLAGFSARTRSTLKRKARRIADLSGGAPDLRSYRSPAELAQFFDLAAPLSRRTYQQRLLDAGLPGDPAFRAEAAALAGRDEVRAFLLFLDGAPISYLYLTVTGDCLHYDYLGYDPSAAALSPGTVLQLEALRLLMAEGRFAHFDFGAGDGDHKRLFANGSVACESFTLMRRTGANRLLLGSTGAIEAAAEAVGRIADSLGVKARLRMLLRRG